MLADHNRLFKHDALVVINEARRTLAKASDRVFVALFLIGVLGSVHMGLAGRPWEFAAALAGGAALFAGVGTGRLLQQRLAFHGSDGVLAADALILGERRRYLASCLAAGLVALIAVTLPIRPSLGAIGLPTYLIGALATYAVGGFVQIDPKGTGRKSVRLSPAVGRSRIWGLVAAALFVFSLAVIQTPTMEVAMTVLAVGYTVLALALSGVDHATVRFMAISGHMPWRIITRHAWGLGSLTVVAVPASWLVMGPLAAGVVAVISTAAVLILAARVFVYGILRKRFANLVVVVIAATATLLAFSAPVLLPPLFVAALWRLHHLASKRAWIIA